MKPTADVHRTAARAGNPGAHPLPPPPPGELWRTVRADLRYSPERWALTWRTAVLCALTGVVFMTYQIPLAAIGCYLIFFILKPDSVESVVMGIGVIVLVSVAVALMFVISNLTLESPPLRLAVIVLLSVLFMWLGVASQVGPAGSILALVFAFLITLFNYVPMGEVLTRGILYAWLMAATPMAILVAFIMLVPLNPVRALRERLARRLEVVATLLEQPGQTEVLQELRELLEEGNAELDKRVALLRLVHVCPSDESRYLATAVSATYQAMLAVAPALGGDGQGLAVVPGEDTPEDLRHLADRVRARARELREGWVPPSATATHAAAAGTDSPGKSAVPSGRRALLVRSLQRLAGDTSQRPDDASAKQPFLVPDALTNPDYIRYALKTTLAALIAYLIYTAIDWQDIHTAMITCYVVALGTTAETVHKLTLRIIGCLIGAALGIFSAHYIIPSMSGVGELGVLLFLGCLLAAWVASGPERISYAGVQIALAFLLTVLQGFGPDPQISVAMDRIWGVLLGNVVMFVVFTQIWPAGVGRVCHRMLREVTQGVHDFVRIPAEHEIGRTAAAAALYQKIGAIREIAQYAPFEPRSQRPDQVDWRQLHEALDEAELHIARISQVPSASSGLPQASLQT